MAGERNKLGQLSGPISLRLTSECHYSSTLPQSSNSIFPVEWTNPTFVQWTMENVVSYRKVIFLLISLKELFKFWLR